MKNLLLAFGLLLLAIHPGFAMSPDANMGQDRLEAMIKDGWVVVAPGVLQRSLGDQKVETLALGPEGFAWTAEQLQAQLRFLQKEYRVRPTAELKKVIRNQRKQIRKMREYVHILSLDTVDQMAKAGCGFSYTARADAFPAEPSPGVRANAEAYFHNDCGASGDTYAYAYAQATLNGTTTTLAQTDPDTGATISSYATANLDGAADCYSYAYGSATSPALGISYSAVDQNSSCLPALSPVFSDVPLGHWARRHIEAIYSQGVPNSCATNPLQYCPAVQLQRSEMARFLLRAKLGGGHHPPAVNCGAPRFLDVPCTHPLAAWIEELASLGITKGCGIPGSYCPDDVVDRSQIAIFLLRTLSGGAYEPPPADCNAPRFLDVPCTQWAAAWIEELARRGITNGCGIPGQYCPEMIVDRSMTAVFLVKAFNYPLP